MINESPRMHPEDKPNPMAAPQRTGPGASDGALKRASGVTRREFLAASTLGAGLTVGSAQSAASPSRSIRPADCIDAGHTLTNVDRDLMEVGIPELQRYFVQRKYTVTEVVEWYLGRIRRYNGIYRP